MDTTIIIAIISAATAITVSIATNFFTRKRELETDWRKQRLEHYKEFMISISGVLEGRSTAEGRQRFALAANNIYLIGSPKVLKALPIYLQESGKKIREQNNHDELLTNLIFAIRDDLGIKPNAMKDGYHVKIWSPGEGQ